MSRRYPVQLLAIGHLLIGPVGLVPSLPSDPMTLWSATACLSNTGQKVFKTGKVIQFYSMTIKCPFMKVDVGIDETG